ncbi:MAG: glycosyl hydrolase family 18 protein [Terriglobales bacterium]
MLRSDRLHVARRRIFSILLILASCIAALPSSAQQNAAAARPLVVGYFRGDSMRRQFFFKDLIARGAAPILDQINYSQANIANNRCIVADPAADLNYSFSAENSVDGTADAPNLPLRGNFHQLQELKRLYPYIKALISIEGNADVFVKAAQPENRSAFVASCVQQFIRGKIADGIEAPGLFDGIDVDWEYPEPADKLNFIALLGEFRRQMNAARPGLLLSVAMGTTRASYQHLDMPAVALYADQVAIMNYDYAGPWSKKTGLVAPLYASPGDPEIAGDVDSTIRSYIEAGVPVSRMLMGLPFYAYAWHQVAPDNHGLFQLGEPDRIDVLYNYIVSIQNKFTVYRDPKSMAPWLFDGNTFWTYDDDLSIAAKVRYAKERDLRGIMIWELSGDTADGKLLKTIAAELGRHDQAGNVGHGAQ